jgi:alkanesulfonate monooxygenase SsuD/methylene tetrahydromethanopterin reductase-like flavin-dependent oxidoreductase (luciferase family)
MDFGLFYYCQGRGAPHDQIYAETLDQIALAERLGFTECWFAEHHLTDYSLLPSPNLMIAAASQRTRRMRFGNYVNIMPFHHPLRLAAEAAMLDNLTDGRFDFGVGKGVRPGEFLKWNLPFAEATAMTDEATEIVLKAWTSETFQHDGHYWQIPEASLRPRVLQRPHPPLHLVASHPESVGRAGARGWPVALHFTPTAEVARCAEAYRATIADKPDLPDEGPYRPRLLLCRETYVGASAAEARAVGELAILGFWHLSALLPPPTPATFSEDLLREHTTRIWGGQTFDGLDELGGFLIGSGVEVARKVEHLENIGVDTLLLVASFGNLSHEQVRESLERFAEAVIKPAGSSEE